MKPLEPEYLHPLEAGEPNTIAVLTTAPAEPVKKIIEKLKSLHPSSSLYLITQLGRNEEIAKVFPGENIIEALPAGIFSAWKAPFTRFGAVRRLRPDILALCYNNHMGTGYFPLEFVSLLFNARSVIGVSWKSDPSGYEVEFCKLAIWRMLLAVIFRIILIPVEIALIIVIGLVFVATTLINRYRQRAF